ncbi:unnamed protein product [Diplocarpon coronariae]
MLRLRRYRVFLFFAIIFIFLVIQVRKRNDWSRPSNVQDTDAPPRYDAHEHEHNHITNQPPIAQQESTKEAPLTQSTTKEQAAQIEPSQSIAAPTAAKPVLPESILEGDLPERIPAPPTTVGGDDDLHAASPPGRQDLSASPAEVAETVHWERQVQHFPIPAESLIRLPTGTPVEIPRIQHIFNDETTDAKINREKRQGRVKEEFKKAWTGYKTKAWLHDELSPVTGNFRDPFCGWAATLVDTLDTLWIMGLQEEFEEAAKAVDLIDFTTSPRSDIPMFETTIRYLGGLVAAYDVSGAKYKNLLVKAEELAEVLIGAFDTPNRMPVLYYHWIRRSNLAELGSLSLEFTRLAQLTKEPKYYDAVARVTQALSEWQDRGTKLIGVFPESVDASGCNRTLPASPQLPQYLLLGGLDDTYHKMYTKTIDAVRKWMLYRPMVPDNRDILFAGSVTTNGDPSQDLILTAEVEHLTCFIGGMFGMGAKIFGIEGDLEIAKKLTDGCVWAYESTRSGVMPESAIVLPCKDAEHCTWNETLYWEYLDPMRIQRDRNVADYDRTVKSHAAASDNKLADDLALPGENDSARAKTAAEKDNLDNAPEAIESVWYMYRITGDSTWQDKGWKMFESIINATSTEYGHSAIYDVTLEQPVRIDEMESFWLAETLKYFYLLYSTPDTISLDEWVLNTEAHPFKRPTA